MTPPQGKPVPNLARALSDSLRMPGDVPLPGLEIQFDAQDCTCPHPPTSHDAGFGCTEPAASTAGGLDPDEPCPCLAGWS